MRIGMVGLGYVGLITAVGLAELGHSVCCHDIDKTKMVMLSQRKPPIYEDGLQEKLNDDSIFNKIKMEDEIAKLVAQSDVIFIAVGTPSSEDGSANTEYVRAVVLAIAQALCGVEESCKKTIVIKSTVPVGFTNEMNAFLQEKIANKVNVTIKFGFCPEFLREGTALNDFMNPERIVVGAEDDDTANHIGSIFETFAKNHIPFVYTNCVSAEIIKYTSNIMLAARVALINEIADYAEIVGGNIADISKAVGLDGRIGSRYLKASLGFGGSCLPKDVKAFSYFSKSSGLDLPLVQSIANSNESHIIRQKERITEVATLYGAKNILVLGTAFKADTDDIRESSAVKLIKGLLASGLNITISDPKALNNTQNVLGSCVSYASDFYSALNTIDMIVICTDWKEFTELDIIKLKQKMKGNVIFDLRNVLNRTLIESNGFKYYGIAN